MLKLARVADVCVELLPLVIVPLSTICLEQVAAVVGEDDRALVFRDGDEPNQALVLKVV